jgi:hypothetical protein
MKPRNTAILALVVAALGAFVWLYEIRGADERADRAAAEKRLFPGVEVEQVSLITLTTKDGEEVRLERVEGEWKILAPRTFPADHATAESLASTLATLQHEATIDDPAPPAEYGLEGPPKVRFRAGDREYELRVGNRSPVGGNTYVATADAKPVHAVASYRVASLERSLGDLRDKRVMRFERDAVVELRVRWKDGAARLVRDDQDPELWRLTEPLAAAADGRAVSKALSDLEFVRASGFEDAPTADVRRSLERPELSVELVTRADGKEATARLALAAAAGGKRFARGNASDAVYQLPAGALEDFPRSVVGWRDKEVARFLPNEARRFELAFHAEGAGESLVVSGRREGDAWKTEPEALRADAVEALLTELSGLQARTLAAESMGERERAALGLEPPRVVIRVFGGPEAGSDAPLAEVQLGVARAESGIAAKRPDRDTVYWLPYERGEQIPLSAEALRQQFVEAPAAAPAPEGAAPEGAHAVEPAPDAVEDPAPE